MPQGSKLHGSNLVEDWTKLLWPTFAAAEAGAALTQQMLTAFSGQAPAPAPPAEPPWTSANEVVLELPAARLRRFMSAETGQPPLVILAPFAIHGAQIADLAPGHSLMQLLQDCGAPLYLIEWRSARPTQAHRRIDDFLSDLNVMIDDIGAPANLIGLCQGGWLSLIYAARFPAKVGKLVLAAAPVDIEAEASRLSVIAQSTPMETFRDIVALGQGLARGGQAQQFWRNHPDTPEAIHALLQSQLPLHGAEFAELAARFRAWSERTLDLPGAYYLEVVEQFYKRNALARGDFAALGKVIALSALTQPLYLIGARNDDVSAPGQTFACARLVGTPKERIRQRLIPGGHIELFLSAGNLRDVWPDVMRWLREAA